MPIDRLCCWHTEQLGASRFFYTFFCKCQGCICLSLSQCMCVWLKGKQRWESIYWRVPNWKRFDAVSVELCIQIKCLYCGEDACVHILSTLLVSLCHYGSTPTRASTRRCQKINPWKNMQTCKSPSHKSVVGTARRCRSSVTTHMFVHMFAHARTIQRFSYILAHTVLSGAGD